MNKIITCASYHGSGSSAISDLLKEFNNCHSCGDYEFRFIQDPYGISDLEFHLVENNHRLNSGYFLKKFKKKIDFLSGNRFFRRYEKYFNNKFKIYSYEYINNLTNLIWQGEWSQELTESPLFYVQRVLSKIFQLLTNNKEREINILWKNKLYFSKPKEKFYLYTKNYLDKLFSEINSKKEFILLDQLVPPTNINRYLKYFSFLKVIIVDRDPRDLYILEKLYWKDNVFPVKNVYDFIEWFKLTREGTDYNNSNILKIKLEDLIFNYEETLKLINCFLNIGLENHQDKRKYFIPEKSIKNTRLWKKHTELIKDIKIIEDELGEYCYSEDKNDIK